MNRHLLLVHLVLLANLPQLLSQDLPLPEQSFEGGSLRTVVEWTEANSGYRFFLEEVLLDSIRIRQGSSDSTLEQVLETSLEATSLSATLDRRMIIILEGPPLQTRTGKPGSEKVSRRKQQVILEDEALPEPEAPLISVEHLVLGKASQGAGRRTAMVSGYITEAVSGEAIIGATVYSPGGVGASTDQRGYYVIKLPRGESRLQVSSIGMQAREFRITLQGDASLNIEMEEAVIQLRGAVVVAEANDRVLGAQTGVMRIETSALKTIPAFAGERDIIKAALLLPGVQTVGEGASGFNVRGGSTDQNLILLNDIPVYNSSHLFGFFSSFNPDVVRDFDLYKSSMPARYGGRVSSVMDVRMKSGNSKEFGGALGLGPVTARLMLEAPIVKEKGSFIIGARTTYSDWILKRIHSMGIDQSSAWFYDVNLNANYRFNSNNEISISAYQSQDRFKLRFDTSYHYQNSGASLKYLHRFSRRLMVNLTLNYARYAYEFSGEMGTAEGFEQSYSIDHKEAKLCFTAFPGEKHKLRFGTSAVLYGLLPGSKVPNGDESLVVPRSIPGESAVEGALFISDEVELSERLRFYAGLRWSGYGYMGPSDVLIYGDGLPLESYTVVDTSSYSQGELIRYYGGPELRLSARYKFEGSSSVKLSYNRTRQYLHMLTNTTAISPTDTWKLSDYHIRPQVGDQYTAGYYRDFSKYGLHASVEVYYKEIQDMLEYKGGAELLLNERIETELINAFGRAYGLELLLERRSGRLNGWMSYTYSRTLVRSESDFARENINQGEYFPANHDKPHDFTAACNYQFTRRFSASGNLTYSTGRPITYPAASYDFRGIPMLHYTNRNEYRLPDYFRIDVSLNLEGNLKSKKIAHSFWSFSVYNLTGRDNVYSIYFVTENGQTQGYKLAIFDRPIVTLSYNLEF